MTKAPYRPNFKRNLARTITLANGQKLKSLDDARTVIPRRVRLGQRAIRRARSRDPVAAHGGRDRQA